MDQAARVVEGRLVEKSPKALPNLETKQSEPYERQVDSPDVVILVRGGVADIVKNRQNLDIRIIDFDNIAAGEDSSLTCPLCLGALTVPEGTIQNGEGRTTMMGLCHPCRLQHRLTYDHDDGSVTYEHAGLI